MVKTHQFIVARACIREGVQRTIKVEKDETAFALSPKKRKKEKR